MHKLAHTVTDTHLRMLTVTDTHFMDTSQTQALSQTHLPLTATPYAQTHTHLRHT